MSDYDDSDIHAKRDGFGIGELGRVPVDELARIEALRQALTPAPLLMRIVEFWTADEQPIVGDAKPEGRMEILHQFDVSRYDMDSHTISYMTEEESRQYILRWIAEHRPDLTWSDEAPDGHGFSAGFPPDSEHEAHAASLKRIAKLRADIAAEAEVRRTDEGQIVRECWDCGMDFTEAEVRRNGGTWSGDNPFAPGTCYCGM